jgi:amidophosphoribosyltransferase
MGAQQVSVSRRKRAEGGSHITSDSIRADKGIYDKCGIFGVWGAPNASILAFEASKGQQHRGDSGAGIVSSGLDPERFDSKHGEGLVREVFSYDDLVGLRGSAAISHVRYPTQGPSIPANLQPFVSRSPNRPIAIAHNGEFSNYKSVRQSLEDQGTLLTTTSDTEPALHMLVKSKAQTIEGRVKETFAGLEPAYSIVILTKNELVGIRDPCGVRPLVIGRLNNSFVLASETIAFDRIGATYTGEVLPGEAVFINDSGMKRMEMFAKRDHLPCIFEHIYFANPVSVQFGGRYSNSEIRLEFGRQLYREHPVSADMVVAVPDSGVDCANGFSEESWGREFIPVRQGLIRSHYAGRTFIAPTQMDRDAKVKEKFYPNSSLISGKRIVVIDDSIVRSTTIKKIIGLLREGGAAEVHVRVSSPMYAFGCYLGIDTPKNEALIAHQLGSVERIREHIRADSLGFLSKEGMLANPYLPEGGSCTYCFDGIEKIRRS